MMSPVCRVCVHTPVMLSAWSKAVGRVRRYSTSHRAAGWGRSSPGSIYPAIRGVNLQAESPSAATGACPFLAVLEERENMGAVRDHRRQAHVNLESSALPKKAQLQHNPSMPGFSDPPRPSLQTKAGWKKTDCFGAFLHVSHIISPLARMPPAPSLSRWDASVPGEQSARPGSEPRATATPKGVILSLGRLTHSQTALLLLASSVQAAGQGYRLSGQPARPR